MLNKKVLIALTVVTALVVPFTVFAGTSDNTIAKNIRGYFRMDVANLTEAQKADVATYSQKAGELQKEFINKMVGNGSMTKEQGDLEIKKIDERIANGDNKGLLPGMGMGQRGGDKRGGFGGGRGQGKPGAFGEQIDLSKLTVEQKNDILDTYKKMALQEKANINKLVGNSFITQEKADLAIKRIDEMLTSMEKDGLQTASFRGGFGGFGGMGGFGLMDGHSPMAGNGPMGMRGSEPSKITEQQKTDLAENMKSMLVLQKELINKMVVHGVMTQEKADIAIKRMDEMSNMEPGEMFKKGNEMGKGRKANEGRGGRGMKHSQQEVPSPSASTIPENDVQEQ